MDINRINKFINGSSDTNGGYNIVDLRKLLTDIGITNTPTGRKDLEQFVKENLTKIKLIIGPSNIHVAKEIPKIHNLHVPVPVPVPNNDVFDTKKLVASLPSVPYKTSIDSEHDILIRLDKEMIELNDVINIIIGQEKSKTTDIDLVIQRLCKIITEKSGISKESIHSKNMVKMDDYIKMCSEYRGKDSIYFSSRLKQVHSLMMIFNRIVSTGCVYGGKGGTSTSTSMSIFKDIQSLHSEVISQIKEKQLLDSLHALPEVPKTNLKTDVKTQGQKVALLKK